MPVRHRFRARFARVSIGRSLTRPTPTVRPVIAPPPQMCPPREASVRLISKLALVFLWSRPITRPSPGNPSVPAAALGPKLGVLGRCDPDKPLQAQQLVLDQVGPLPRVGLLEEPVTDLPACRKGEGGQLE